MADDFTTLCRVCHRPLELDFCVTDENGCVIHESCYEKALSDRLIEAHQFITDLIRQMSN